MRRLPSIFHVDLDAFYASVEQLHKPSLRGKPVVVGGIGNRGVVSTASYEARAFGVHSALATGIARRRAPNAAYLIPRFGAYQAYSERVMALMHELSPLVEPLSLDEAFIDISHLFGSLDTTTPHNATLEARRIAEDLRTRIKNETGLTASVGAGTSKLIAKIASDAEKPDGLVVIEPGTEQTWLDPLPVRALWGVGPATAERLRKIGATTVADLRTLSLTELTTVVGASYGTTLYAIARGQDDRDVSTDREMKSVSVEDTYAEDLLDPATITAHMDDLVTRLSTRIRKAGRSGRTITIKVRGHDFTTVSRSETTPNPTDDLTTIRAATHRMLPGAVAAATQSVPGIRLLGVGLTGLAEWAQVDLFTAAEDLDAALEIWEHAADPTPPKAPPTDDDFDMPRGILTREPPRAESSEATPTPGITATATPTTVSTASATADPAESTDRPIGDPAAMSPTDSAPDPTADSSATTPGDRPGSAPDSSTTTPADQPDPGHSPTADSSATTPGDQPDPASSPTTESGTTTPGDRPDPGPSPTAGSNATASGDRPDPASSPTAGSSATSSAEQPDPGPSPTADSSATTSADQPGSAPDSTADSTTTTSVGQPDPAPSPNPADVMTPVATVEGERSPRQFGPLPPGTRGAVEAAVGERRFLPGQDVVHEEFGGGWVQGSGLGRVTVRFESPWSGVGRIKTLRAEDGALQLVDAASVAREALARLVAHAPEPGVSIGSMTDEPTKTEVVDNELEDRFELWYGDRLAGFASYRRRGGGTVFVHTVIEPEFEGKGLGSVLARQALDATVARGEEIIPVCPFISAYLRKHPEYDEHVQWPAP